MSDRTHPNAPDVAESELPKGPDALKAASEVSGSVSLNYVRMASGSFLDEIADYDTKNADAVKFNCQFEVDVRKIGISSTISLKLKIPLDDPQDSSASTEKLVASISASIEVDYLYDKEEEETPSDVALVCFGRINSLYNAWPYWREFVQNCTIRMNLPPFTLPLLRPQDAVNFAGLGLPPKQDEKS